MSRTSVPPRTDLAGQLGIHCDRERSMNPWFSLGAHDGDQQRSSEGARQGGERSRQASDRQAGRQQEAASERQHPKEPRQGTGEIRRPQEKGAGFPEIGHITESLTASSQATFP